MQVQLNGEPHEFSAVPSTLASLIESLGFAGKRIAVERNGDIVPKSQYQITQLNENDRLEVIVAVGGG